MWIFVHKNTESHTPNKKQFQKQYRKILTNVSISSTAKSSRENKKAFCPFYYKNIFDRKWT